MYGDANYCIEHVRNDVMVECDRYSCLTKHRPSTALYGHGGAPRRKFVVGTKRAT